MYFTSCEIGDSGDLEVFIEIFDAARFLVLRRIG